MDDMRDKFKGFMKKVSSSSSSSSNKFKGHGRVLGGGSSDSSSGPANPIHTRYSRPANPNPSSRNFSPSNLNPPPQRKADSDQKKPTSSDNRAANRPPANEFDPYGSLITTGKRSQNGYSLNIFECPVCGQSYGSEEEVSIHVETCVNNNNTDASASVNGVNVVVDDGDEVGAGDEGELEACVGRYLSGNPGEGSVEVVLRLLKNVVREPENAKFRKIRMGNPKIREAVTEVAGGVELLEFVGFELKEEGGEIWAVMEGVHARIRLIEKVVRLLELGKTGEQPKKAEDKPSVAAADTEERVEPKKIDRQIRVFFSVPESVAAKIELPDSFYNLSLEEVKREADMRKKKMAESQLLIPKSYKEKQAKASRKKYSRTIIRVQFPDGVVLQGVFAPWEPTTALYEFVSTALKDPSLEFELLDPVLVKRRVIPHFPGAGERAKTLDNEGLVPSALIKFRPIETDSAVFTGLCNELLEISEPLG